jgi:acyl transferase domain-containing protein
MFFNISPKEAESMDVTQRIVLEESYRALEDAGYAPSSLREQPVGTFLGAMGNAPMAQDFSHFSMLGSETSILSSRLAYFLDLKGPALAINTACSSSLVAIDLACQQLKSHEINLAIAGGITIYTHPGAFITMNNAGMLSLTGECRPFDNMANGIVVGDGVGIVILKRLKDAERDRDRIYGIIRGSGTNQDGQTSGITVPSFMSQSQLEESIYRKNKINVEDIQYIEAHGTATKLGDPVEIHALNHSFQKFTEKRGFCAIGSLKGNIGHTTAAAGVLGVIKVLLSLKYHKLPPSIHFSKGNEHIDFERSPLYVNTKLQEWQAGPKGSRLAAVSSFGFSGTNAHMVIGEYNNHLSMKNDQLSMKTGPALIVLSAKNEDRLKEMVKNLHSYLTVHCEPDLSKVNGKSSISLADLAYTLQVGREAMEERLGFLVESLQELDTKLQRFIEGQGYEEDLYRGQAKPNTETLAVLTVDEDIAKAIDSWIDKRKFSKLLALWTKGLNFDWNKLYRDAKPSRISLPTYPFAKEHYRSNTFASQDQIETNDNCRIKRVDANSDQVSAPEVQEPLDTMCFEEVWQETALPEIISKASLSPNGRRPK